MKEKELIPATDKERKEALGTAIVKLDALVFECSRGMYISERQLPPGEATTLATLTTAIRLLTAYLKMRGVPSELFLEALQVTENETTNTH